MTGGNRLECVQIRKLIQSWLSAGQVELDVEPGVIVLSMLDSQNFVATIPGTNSIVRMSTGQLDLLENTDGLSASMMDLDMVSLDVGWGRSVNSNCAGSIPEDQAGLR